VICLLTCNDKPLMNPIPVPNRRFVYARRTHERVATDQSSCPLVWDREVDPAERVVEASQLGEDAKNSM
jgi:hypothetical protein